MNKISRTINKFNKKMGEAVSWLTLLMVVLMAFSVILRYLFNTTLMWQLELTTFLYGIVFLAAAAYTLQRDGHVRVDIFYQRCKPRQKRLVNLIGTCIFLIPFCIAIIYLSFDFVLASWHILEESSEYQGMKGVFILKSFIIVFAVSMLLQGISVILKNYEL